MRRELLWALTSLLVVVSAPYALHAQSEQEDEQSWSLDLSYQQYFLSDEPDLGIPSVGVSWNDWYVLGRYQYEARDSGSLWVGKTFSFGESWEWEVTPLVGVVFGDLQGVAPGLLVDLGWNRFQFYSELEYVFATEDRDENFFYSWSQITFSILDWLRVGVVGSRMRAYDSSVELDRGPLVEVDLAPVTLSCAVLNVDSDAIVTFSVAVALPR